MFSIEFSDIEYKFVFKHLIKEEPRRTICTVFFKDNSIDSEEYTLQQESIVSEKDQYSKATGRKVSLKRMLDYLNFNREMRTKVWNKYWQVSKRRNNENIS